MTELQFIVSKLTLSACAGSPDFADELGPIGIFNVLWLSVGVDFEQQLIRVVEAVNEGLREVVVLMFWMVGPCLIDRLLRLERYPEGENWVASDFGA